MEFIHHFDSFIPLTYKKGLICLLNFRIFNLCSNWSIIHKEINDLKTFLDKNKYPHNFVDSTISRILEKLIVKSAPKPASEKKEFMICLPYLGQQTLILKKRLRKLFSTTCPQTKLKTIFSSAIKLSTIFSFKDKIPKHISSLVLYKYTCDVCNASYIGKTKRHLKVRLCEHLGISNKTGKALKYNPNNATVVKQHLVESNHQGDFSNFEVIGRAKTDYQLLIKESLLIARLNPSLNKQIDSYKLQLFN